MKVTTTFNDGERGYPYSATDMCTGDLARILSPPHFKGAIILRAYEILICLYSPVPGARALSTTWRHDTDFEIEFLKPGNSLTLTVESDEE